MSRDGGPLFEDPPQGGKCRITDVVGLGTESLGSRSRGRYFGYIVEREFPCLLELVVSLVQV